jgi:hypothetical protein
MIARGKHYGAPNQQILERVKSKGKYPEDAGPSGFEQSIAI